MQCAANQVDINKASVTELSAALKVDRPTAERVVGFRPYLAPRDLLVVEGIGPDRLAGILSTGSMCATPISLPPPSNEACQSSGAVDLQVASAREMASKLKISMNAAQNIVLQRPFATRRHVTPERVPGVGKGQLPDLLRRTCLTPAPVDTATSSWRWAYQDLRTVAQRGNYKLNVPANVLDQFGAWLAITYVAPSSAALDTPAADFHIWGPWADGTQTVGVTLPPDPFGDSFPGWKQAVFHGPLQNATVFGGVGVDTSDGLLTVQATSLSEFRSVAQPPSVSGYLGGERSTAEVATQQVQDDLARFTPDALPNTCSPDITDATGYVSVVSEPASLAEPSFQGGRLPAASCFEGSLRADDVTWRAANNTGLAYTLQPGYNDDRISLKSINYDYETPTFMSLGFAGEYFAKRHNAGASVLDWPPAIQADFNVPLNPVANTVKLNYDPLLTASYTITRYLSTVVAGSYPGKSKALLQATDGGGALIDAIDCAEIKGGVTVGLLASCASAISSLGGQLVTRAILIPNAALDLGETVRAAWSNITGLGTPPSGNVYVGYKRQQVPTTTPSGGIIFPACTWTDANGRAGYDEQCQAAYEGALNATEPPDDSGCWRFDQLAGSWVLDASAGQQCLLVDSGGGGLGADGNYYNEGTVFCGVGTCITLPGAAGRIVELSDGRSFYLTADGSAWHLKTIDAYFSCGGYENRLYNNSWGSWKWGLSNMARFTIRGDIYGCPVP